MGFVDENNIDDVLAGSTVEIEVEPEAEVETPEVEAEVEEAPEAEAPAPTDWEARVKEWGGEQEIADAIAIAQALRDEEGVQALVQEGLRHMGYDPDEVLQKKAVAEEQAAIEEEDPDRLLTAREVEERLNARIEAERAARQAEAQKSVDTAAMKAIHDSIEALDLEDEQEARIVLAFAQNHAGADERDPHVLENAIKQGYSDYLDYVGKVAQKRLIDKADKAKKVPTNLKKSGTPGADEVKPPKNLDEAKAAARRMLAEAGETVE